MAKFYGEVGYAVLTESAPGVWVEEIKEHLYYGDLVRDTRQMNASDSLNDSITISNSFSIVADPFANANFHSMRYISYLGTKWRINNVEVQRPRLILSVGGIFNE